MKTTSSKTQNNLPKFYSPKRSNNNLFALATIAAVVLFLCSSCIKDEPLVKSPVTIAPASVTVTINVSDELNHSPLNEVWVSANFFEYSPHIDFWTGQQVDGYNTVASGVTDSAGQSFIEVIYHFNPYSRITWLETTRLGYQFCCRGYSYGSQSEVTVTLRPVSYMKVHLNNILPNEITDEIIINSYPDAYDGTYNLNPIVGAQIDTTFILACSDNQNSYLRYTSVHNGVSKDSTMSGIVLNVNDTTTVEIIY